MLMEDEKLKAKVNEYLLKYPIILAQRDSCEKIQNKTDSLRIVYREEAQSTKAKLDTTTKAIENAVILAGLKPLKPANPIKDIRRLVKVAKRREKAAKIWSFISLTTTISTAILLIKKK